MRLKVTASEAPAGMVLIPAGSFQMENSIPGFLKWLIATPEAAHPPRALLTRTGCGILFP